jgi:hypothetical protein
MIAEMTGLSEGEHILEDHKRTEEKLRRLSRTYIDGLIAEADYVAQRTPVWKSLKSFVIPESDATLNAGAVWTT